MARFSEYHDGLSSITGNVLVSRIFTDISKRRDMVYYKVKNVASVKCHTMKEHRCVQVKLHVLFTLAPDGGKYSDWCYDL
jgi:hypothetical protein